MSYSRWISSDFYTYWKSPVTSNKSDNVLACHIDLADTHELTYRQCKEYLVDQEALKIRLGINTDEVEELRVYMKRFIKDVDQEFDDIPHTESPYG
jgi:hypothetical protein